MMTPDFHWHLFLHYCPRLPEKARTWDTYLAREVVRVTPDDLNQPLGICFDRAFARINALPGGFCEPDGAWGWNVADSRTRAGGTLHALDDRLMCVESYGHFGTEDWDEFLRLLELPCSETVVQLVELGTFLSTDAMRDLFETKRGER